MDWNDGAGIALAIKWTALCLTTGFGESKVPVGTLPPTPCQYDWRDGCDKTATWRVGCGPDVRFYCDSHEGPPCGGVFLGEFVITARELRRVGGRGQWRLSPTNTANDVRLGRERPSGLPKTLHR